MRGQASIDVSDITNAILEDIKSSEVFNDLIEYAVASSEKLAELSDAIKENADGLAAAVGSNKQTAGAIIGNALAIADGKQYCRQTQIPVMIASVTNL